MRAGGGGQVSPALRAARLRLALSGLLQPRLGASAVAAVDADVATAVGGWVLCAEPGAPSGEAGAGGAAERGAWRKGVAHSAGLATGESGGRGQGGKPGSDGGMGGGMGGGTLLLVLFNVRDSSYRVLV